jgi:ATP-dependent protease ClpP protease subunit
MSKKPKAPKAVMPKSGELPWYTVRALGADSAEVLIYGDIGESWFGESVTAKQFVGDLQALADKSLTVRINSFGGSVADGLAIFNAIRNHPLPTTVAVDGVAISIASLIAMAGDTVTMAENALMMIHDPWGGAVGNATVMRQYADVLDTHAKAMATSYASQTGQPIEDMLALITNNAEHWYTADEALAAGLVDSVTAAANDGEAASQAARYRQQAFSRFKVPAAVAAGFRQPPQEVINMPEVINQAAAAPTAAPAAPDTNVVQIEQAAEARALAALKDRNAAIDTAFGKFMHVDGVADLHRACLSDPAVSAQQAAAKLLAKLGEGSAPIAPTASGRVGAGQDQRDKHISAMGQALAARMGADKPDAANPFRGMRLHELARASLRASGVNPDGMSLMDIASAALSRQAPRGAQTTSDFPVILENTLHKLVLTGFMAQTSTWQRFCKIGDVSDFRAWQRLVPGLLGNLDTVNEAGEYKNKAIPDGVKNSVTATRKGNIIQITPETLINDDTGYIQTMASGLGATGQRAIERAVYAVLTANANLSDGVPLFHATHANLAGSGAVPSVATLDAARQAMMSQTAPGADAEYLDISPAVAVVPLAQGGNMRVLVNAVYDPDTANKLQRPNMVNGIVKDIVESPRAAGTAWYLFADPNVAACLEVVFLDGQRAPMVTEEINFRTSGLAWKIEMPFGVGAVSHLGGYKNPGA